MPGWLRTSLVIAAIAGGALLLWFGFLLVVAGLAIALVPYWLWTLVARKRETQGPTTVDGRAVVVETSPLTGQEKALLAATPVWVVWYEDQFHVGAERDSFGVGVCFSEEDAKAFIERTGGKMLVPGFDGHEILGPENPLMTPLFGEQRAEIIGRILSQLETGSRAPIPMRITYKRAKTVRRTRLRRQKEACRHHAPRTDVAGEDDVRRPDGNGHLPLEDAPGPEEELPGHARCRVAGACRRARPAGRSAALACERRHSSHKFSVGRKHWVRCDLVHFGA